MCDPVSLTIAAVGMSAGGMVASNLASSDAERAQQKTMNQNSARAGAAFDQRMLQALDSDERVMALQQGQYGDSSNLDDRTFAYLLDQDKQSADAQFGAAQGLMTEQKRTRLERQQIGQEEANRQAAIQSGADNAILGLIPQLGFGGQAADAAAAEAGRNSLVDYALRNSNTGHGFDPTADELVQRKFAASGAAARQNVEGEANAASAAYSFADALAKAKAAQAAGDSAAALVPGARAVSADLANRQLGVRDLQDQNAAEKAAFDSNLAQQRAQQLKDIFSSWAGKQGQSQQDYYTRALQSENAFTSGMIGSNAAADNTMTSLANYKIANTKANTMLGDLLNLGAQAAGAAAAGAGAGLKTTTPFAPLTTYPVVPANTVTPIRFG